MSEVPMLTQSVDCHRSRWIACLAKRSHGLLVDTRRADSALGRVLPPPPIAPDPRGQTHDSLTVWWWPLELLPHSYYDPLLKRARWRIPLGARRVIPDGSILHSTVEEKIRVDAKYKPPNLPQNPDKELGNPCQLRSPTQGVAET